MSGRNIFAIDTEAIRAALAAGVELPFAKIGVPGTHVRIK